MNRQSGRFLAIYLITEELKIDMKIKSINEIKILKESAINAKVFEIKNRTHESVRSKWKKWQEKYEKDQLTGRHTPEKILNINYIHKN